MKRTIENIIVMALLIVSLGFWFMKNDYAQILFFLTLIVVTYLMYKRGMFRKRK